MDKVTKNEIKKLKKLAKKLYIRLGRNNDLSCGLTLSEYLYPDLAKDAKLLNETMCRLKEIDSTLK